MGHSQAEKAETHARIVAIAARRLRERGLDGVGVADLMKEAGLTVGGFYKHFASRDALVAEAVDASTGRWQKRIAAGETPSAAELIDEYLSPDHRDNPGLGCPISALAPDLARADAETRAVATADIRRTIGLLAGLLADPPDDAARRRAMLTYSALIGAVAVARVVDDDALSRDILGAVATELKAP
jgi:TetR/AcrR family transcriptional repressor of nem operon